MLHVDSPGVRVVAAVALVTAVAALLAAVVAVTAAVTAAVVTVTAAVTAAVVAVTAAVTAAVVAVAEVVKYGAAGGRPHVWGLCSGTHG